MTRPAATRRCRRCAAGIPPDSGGRARSARGLCLRCYARALRADEIHDWERVTRSRDELLADYELLRAEGLTWRQCAERLGMSYASFERAMLRARREGDPRARRAGERRVAVRERPGRVRNRDEVLDAYVPLRDRGLPLRECAAALGMDYQALTAALRRARENGDPRAQPGGTLHPATRRDAA